MKCQKRSKPKYCVGDKVDCNFKTAYGPRLTIKEGVVSRVVPGMPFTYNLSDQDGKSIAEGIHEDDLKPQRDESRSLWYNKNSKDAEKAGKYYRRAPRQGWISTQFSYTGLGLFWRKHRDMFSLLGVIIYFLIRHPPSWRRIKHWVSKYPLASFVA